VTAKEGRAFAEERGIVLQAAHGPFPSLAETISDSPDLLVCKLVDDRVTYVHRRLWPTLVFQERASQP
jgi:hypothetical protein